VRRRGALVVCVLAIAAACGPGTGPPASAVSPPVNTCTGSCSAYIQLGVTPTCSISGICEAPSAIDPALVVTVSLSQDSFFSPGETFAIPYGQLPDGPHTPGCDPGAVLPCTNLPASSIVQGAYLVTPQEQSPAALDWNLGNPGLSTALPVHVTYRPLWVSPGALASGAVDADTLGLPLDLVPAMVADDFSPSSPPGPGQGISVGFQAVLQPALYEATIQPDPPFDAAFPPDVKRVTLAAGSQNDEDMLAYDTTTLETGGTVGREIPTFSLSRVGGLEGFTSYLRDPTTLRRISSLATLGSDTMAVSLPTNHHPADGDALTNAELVIAPPDGQPIPLYRVALQGGQLSEAEAYPTLPPPAKVSGTVVDVGGANPVEADLYFEAESVYIAGQPPALNTANFEYTGTASARLDAGTGASTYSVTLPPGQYRLTVRPTDTLHQVTVTPAYTVDPITGAPGEPLLVDAPRPVQGFAFVSDGRPLAGAVVDAVPASCSADSLLCLPRDARTTCADDGSFRLSLDPGGYVLRIQPSDGTHLPWVTQAMVVGSVAVTVPKVVVPAPVHAAQQLLDPLGNPVVAAIVRFYMLPRNGPAVEVGRALTDTTGVYDMYLAPSSVQ
jgi:hypothetical protein